MKIEFRDFRKYDKNIVRIQNSIWTLIQTSILPLTFCKWHGSGNFLERSDHHNNCSSISILWYIVFNLQAKTLLKKIGLFANVSEQCASYSYFFKCSKFQNNAHMFHISLMTQVFWEKIIFLRDTIFQKIRFFLPKFQNIAHFLWQKINNFASNGEGTSLFTLNNCLDFVE